MLKKLIGNKVSKSVLDKKFVILGGIFCVVSFGLLLGAIVSTIASLLVIQGGFSLIAGIMLGFWITFILSIATGITLILTK